MASLVSVDTPSRFTLSHQILKFSIPFPSREAFGAVAQHKDYSHFKFDQLGLVTYEITKRTQKPRDCGLPMWHASYCATPSKVVSPAPDHVFALTTPLLVFVAIPPGAFVSIYTRHLVSLIKAAEDAGDALTVEAIKKSVTDGCVYTAGDTSFKIAASSSYFIPIIKDDTPAKTCQELMTTLKKAIGMAV